MKTKTVIKVERLKQTVLELKEKNKTVKLKIKELIKTISNLRKENPFDFTEFVEMQKGENEIDLRLFFDLIEKKTKLYATRHQYTLSVKI